MMVAWGEGKVGNLFFNGYRVSVWENEVFLEIEDDCTTMNVLNDTELHA